MITSVVGSVVRRVGSPNFRDVYLTKSTQISTFRISRGRYLRLGLLCLKYLTLPELMSVVAHECAHHHRSAMLVNRVYYRISVFGDEFASAVSAASSISKRFIGKWVFLPLDWLLVQMPLRLQQSSGHAFSLFLALIERLTFNSKYEFYCDRVAIEFYGSSALTSALQKILDVRMAELIVMEATDNPKLSSLDDKYLIQIDEAYQRLRTDNPPIRQLAAKLKTDSHPPINLRLERARTAVCAESHQDVIETADMVLNDEQFVSLWHMVGSTPENEARAVPSILFQGSSRQTVSAIGKPRGLLRQFATGFGGIVILATLLVAGFLFRHDLHQLSAWKSEWDTDLFEIELSVSTKALNDQDRMRTFFTKAHEQLEALPGIVGVSVCNNLPVSTNDVLDIAVEDSDPDAGQPNPLKVKYDVVGPSFFRMLELPLKGRTFNETDISVSEHVTIISESVANRLFPQQEPIGEHITTIDSSGNRGRFAVVGVILDGRPLTSNSPGVYFTYQQQPIRSKTLLIRFPDRNLKAIDRSISQFHSVFESADEFICFKQRRPSKLGRKKSAD